MSDELYQPPSSPRFQSLEEYVNLLGGKRSVRTILIANNGLGALKAIRSMRKWSFENFGTQLLRFCAMATPEDIQANSEFIRFADQYIEVPGGTNNHNYANVPLIIDCALRVGAEAVWAGWGHASEFPSLPTSCLQAGIIFMGPGAKAMRDLGDKIGSTLIGQSSGVPCAPWSGSHITIDYANTKEIPAQAFKDACVETVSEAIRIIETHVGYPAMIKASEGGGGKGIRKVLSHAEIEPAFRAVQAEVPGSPIFIMKMLSNCRHLEVQIVADAYGEAIALYSRDCSVQRRHQKIFEEGPVVGVPQHILRTMEQSAVQLAKSVGYEGAGTVEYIYGTDGSFYLLELNPRLQVEHPVTEGITKINLPSVQLQIAMGLPLNRIPDIRRFYGFDPYGHELLDFSAHMPLPPHGHVIACRITSENSQQGFKPTGGQVDELTFRTLPNVWGYFSVRSLCRIHEFADSQFGHIFAWGADREAARKNLIAVLHDLTIRGEIFTPIEFLLPTLELPEYRNLQFHTSWLDGLIAEANQVVSKEQLSGILVAIIGAIFQTVQSNALRAQEFSSYIERGQMPPTNLLQPVFRFDIIYEGIKYRFVLVYSSPKSITVLTSLHTPEDPAKSHTSSYSSIPESISSSHSICQKVARLISRAAGTPINPQSVVRAEFHQLNDGGMFVLLDGKKHVCYGREEATGLRLIIDHRTYILPKDDDPTVLRTITPGKLIQYLVSDGSHVEVGTPYAEIEVMKMYMTLTSTQAGRIQLTTAVGATLNSGDVLARLQLDDPSAVKQTTLFTGSLPLLSPPRPIPTQLHQQFQEACQNIQNIMTGYVRAELQQEFIFVLAASTSLELVILQFREILSNLSSRLPPDFIDGVSNALGQIDRDLLDLDLATPTSPIVTRVLQGTDDAQTSVSAEEIHQEEVLRALIHRFDELLNAHICSGDARLQTAAAPFIALVELYRPGFRGRLNHLIAGYLREYLATEKYFLSQHSREETFKLLSELPKEQVVGIVLSTSRVSRKADLLLHLLDFIGHSSSLTATHAESLQKIALLDNSINMELSLKARQLSIRNNLPSFSSRRTQVRAILEAALAIPASTEREVVLAPLIRHSRPLIDVLAVFFDDENVQLSLLALEIYIRRCYYSYRIDSITPATGSALSHRLLQWTFLPKVDADNELNKSTSSPIEDDASPRASASPQPVLPASTDELFVKHSRNSSILRRPESIDRDLCALHNLSNTPSSPSQSGPRFRYGCLVVYPTHHQFEAAFESLIEILSFETNPSGFLTNVMNVALTDEEGILANHDENAFSQRAAAFFFHHRDALRAKGIRRVTVMITLAKLRDYPLCFTFRDRLEFQEDTIYRNIEPPLAHNLEIDRLSNFEIERFPTEDRQILLYKAVDKTPNSLGGRDIRFFTRALVRQPGFSSSPTVLSSDYQGASELLASDNAPSDLNTLRTKISSDLDLLLSEIERVLLESIRALEIAVHSELSPSNNHHIFLRIMTEILLDPTKIGKIITMFGERYGRHLWRLHVSELELALKIRSDPTSTNFLPVRFIVQNPSGYHFRVYFYTESKSDTADEPRYVAVENWGLSSGELHNQRIDSPYPRLSALQRKRFEAQAIKTTYVYDAPELFTTALHNIWQDYNAQWRGVSSSSAASSTSFGRPVRNYPNLPGPQFTELILENGQLVETYRAPGMNSCGMVVWKALFSTPECPDGREVIIVANDITFFSGSFGTAEDDLFFHASAYARQHHIPRIYISANSGARIGLAQEVQRLFRAKWKDDADPTKGFDYLYLADEDYKSLNADPAKPAVLAQFIPSLNIWKIDDIIGLRHGLGVENLMGSGLIAGETSRAYNEIFTITLVTGRSVGIGAYLVRLGQRTIQNEAPIILTGAAALNKVLGREVYSSNHQLGGPQIMFNNGVSHIDVHDELKGVTALLRWLSYVPAKIGLPPPLLFNPKDSIDRLVAVAPSPSPYDPRTFLCGIETESGWQGGFCDRDSFVETLSGWARTVVCGRARLGGIPIGIIAVETRTIDKIVPADPANLNSQKEVISQPGQVWFPNSAYKTAQAIRDFDKGENLPLFIFANWRGFSGGMRDMFDEVLKYGSYIVDALNQYRQPVFVYLPPHAELRGGAWVVVDPNINSEMMEMYADIQSRGGVLEPSGTVEIKYRSRDLIQTIQRLDERILELKSQQNGLESRSAEYKTIQRQIDDRVNHLLPIYQQLALKFADLHDTPGRMLAKGAIQRVLEWPTSRLHLYCRLRFRLAEERLKSKIRAIASELPIASLLHECLQSAPISSSAPLHIKDLELAQWLENPVNTSDFLTQLERKQFQQQVTSLLEQNSSAFCDGVLSHLDRLSETDRTRLLQALSSFSL